MSDDTMLRGAMLGTLLLPCLALCVWAYYADDDAPPPLSDAHPLGEPLSFTTDEYEAETVFELPPEHEAVRQIREVMEGKIALCAVCKGQSDPLYRVQMADDSAFCCAVCAALLRAGSVT